MTIQTLITANAKVCLGVAALLVPACGEQGEVRRADAAYQRALALDDLVAQRNALLALTRADEDESEYWMRLARIELELGAYPSAYERFARVHEIDRTAVYPLSIMTELAVINGRMDLANKHLKELIVIAPNDRAVAVARGFGALREANYEAAQANADILLAQNSGDSIANILQTRILVTQKKFPEAIDRLKRKLGPEIDDRAILRSLAAIYRYLGQWQQAAPLDLRLWKLSPRDLDLARQSVFDALKANDRSLASKVTERVLIDAQAKDELDKLLSVWVKLAPADNPPFATVQANAPDAVRIALAHYLNQIGRTNQALTILGRKARPLGDRANVRFNAVFAESLSVSGQVKPAQQILDRVLAAEPDNAIALSTRARLLSSAGDHRKATIDAQRLVASYRTNPDYRVLLTKVYRASRDNRAAERTLWEGYRDLPLAEPLYEEVRKVLMARGDAEGILRLERTYNEARFAQLLKDLA